MILSENLINTNLSKYDVLDEALIASKEFVRIFGLPQDYVEAHLYSSDGRLLDSNYNFTGYTIPGNLKGETTTTTEQLSFTPGNYIESLGYIVGTYDIQFNILRKQIFNTNQPIFFIKEISSDRTELVIISNDISSADVENGVLNFINEMQSSPYYKDFLLNFGDDKLVNAVNIALDKNTDPYNILVKLYNPLPSEFSLKSTLWFVEELSTPIVFQVELFPAIKENPVPKLRSANFDINVDQNSIKPSNYYNSVQLLSNNSLSSYRELLNSLNNPGIQINVDYSDYSNFIHFSSAKQRLINFYYKVKKIETYNSDIASIKSIPNYNVSVNTSQSAYNLEQNINNIIQNFDGYENYLYFNSGSSAWPKSNSLPPYTLYSSTSTQVINWLGSDDYNSNNYGGQLYSASFYDRQNPDNLVYTVPEFIIEDISNEQYALFLEMIGQHFDNIWIYIKTITDQYNTANSTSQGISKDLVYYALRSLGIKIYNSKSDDNIFKYLIGSSVSGSYILSGSQYETLISASVLAVPGQDIQKEQLKRIYHNLPLLLKSKGTANGIRALINTFGIPSSILDINEFGGSDKTNKNIEYTYDRFSYALYNSGSNISVGWYPQYDYTSSSYTTYAPDSIELRFNPDKSTYYTTQSIFELSPSGSTNRNMGVLIKPDTTKGFPYSIVTTYLSGSAGFATSSLSAPLYYTSSTGEMYWWNIMVSRNSHYNLSQTGSNQSYITYVKNRVDTRIGHQLSSSINIIGSTSSSYNLAWNSFSQSLYVGGSGKSNLGDFKSNYSFQGKLQEFRLWYSPLSESAFNYHTLNPISIEGNTPSVNYSYLDYRFPLGNDLYTYNHYSNATVNSYDDNYKLRLNSNGIAIHTASFSGFPNKNNYVYNEEEYVTDSPNSVYSNNVNQKVRIISNFITGSALSPFIRLEDDSKNDLTKDLHYADVSFSPQNQINNDIIAEYGGTVDIDNLIGDPRDSYKSSYPTLISQNQQYYSKFLNRYNLKDFIKLIQYFDNSLFKMVSDFVPARTNLQTGLTIKSPILERPKAKIGYVEPTINYNYFSSEIPIHNVASGDSNYTSSYSDGRDFYNGELSGSLINIHNEILYKNYNKYLYFTSSLNTNLFEHSDFNVTLNNVSASAVSKIFKAINIYQPGVLEDVEIQDSLYSDPIFTRPRYTGVKSTSKSYNIYTPGDSSYGQNAAIDYNTTQFAWINQVADHNLDFYDKTKVNIKFLIDASGSTRELSRKNDNLFAVQNIFKNGDSGSISLLDPYNPSNQISLEGEKIIWQSGINYSPLLFRESNEPLYYNYTSSIITPAYPTLTATQTSDWEYSTIIYSDGNPGQYNRQIDLDIGLTPKGYNLTYGINQLSSGQFALTHLSPFSSWQYASPSQVGAINNGSTVSSTHGDSLTEVINLSDTNQFVYKVNPSYLNFSDSIITDDTISKYTQVSDGSWAYIVPRNSSHYNIDINIPFNISIDESRADGATVIQAIAVLEKSTDTGNTWSYLEQSTFSHVEKGSLGQQGWDPHVSMIFLDGNSFNGGNDSPLRVYCTISLSDQTFNAGDCIRVSFFIIRRRNFLPTDYVNTARISFKNRFSYPPTENILSGTFSITDNNPSDVVYNVNTGSVYTDSSVFTVTGTNNNILQLTSNATTILWNKVVFVPKEPQSELYSSVKYPFYVHPGDIIRLENYYTYNPTIYNVLSVNNVAGLIQIELDKSIPTNIINLGVSSRFAIFRKENDETNIYFSFIKINGSTSSGIIIPWNLDKDIKNNVSNIIGPLKPKLLSTVLTIT
jgi:hypothetical protein